MKIYLYLFCGAIWLAVLACMLAAGPVGNHLYLFSLLYGLAFGGMLFLVHTFPDSLESGKAFALILIIGLAARVIFLFYPFSNDVFRYVWEGYIQNRGFNPYAVSPESSVLNHLVQGDFQTIWQNINQRHLTAAYPPLALLLFRVLAGIKPDPLVFKMIMLLFDLGVMIVLAMMIRLKGIKPSRLLFYAANPLVILYVAGEGHLDAIQVFFLCLGLYLIMRKSEISGFIALGLALVSKYLAGAAIPFLVSAKNWKKCLAILIALIFYFPFLDAGAGIFSSLAVFGSSMHYNDSIYALLRYLFGNPAALIAIAALVMCFVTIFLFEHDQLKSVYLAIGCLLVLLPTLHPWYLVLIAPFMVFFPSSAWLYLQAAAVFTFPVVAVDQSSGVFQEIFWLKIFEYLPFYVLLVRGLFRQDHYAGDRLFSTPQSISVVIPALNESTRIQACLKALKNRKGVTEIIVADGGSTDGTRPAAHELGARVIQSPPGRGFQIKAGVEAASADVVLVLHADCIAVKGLFSRLLEELSHHPYAAGGAFGMRFESGRLPTKIVGMLNNARAIVTGIAFGDQAQFFRREALEMVAGYPAMLLMEDVELSFKLKQAGGVLFLKNGVRVSGRRWNNGGFYDRLAMVLRLFFHYLIERRLQLGDKTNAKYYNLYYAKTNRKDAKLSGLTGNGLAG